MTDETVPTVWRYGVMHVVDGRDDSVRHALDRTDAEDEMRACRDDGQACYLVRQPVDQWERVPDA